MGSRAARRRVVVALSALALVVSACSDTAPSTPTAGATTTSPITVASVEPGTPVSSARFVATIRRTSYGVAHVVAADWGSLGFGQGYAHAEDHPCDLLDQVLLVRGERARWFGPGSDDQNIESDAAVRHLGIFAEAEAELAAQPERIRSMLEGYSAGFSQAIIDIGVDELPSWCAGEPWVQPIDAVDIWAYGRLLGLRTSGLSLLDLIGAAGPPPETLSTTDDETAASGPLVLGESYGASNGWAIGSERSASGAGMLVSNTHFPWEGELRWWESHLTIPGELDAYGASLLGVPGINVGFNRDVAWTHTVSAFGRRFTVYSLDLVEGDPTRYRYGDDEMALESTSYAIEVLGDDGEVSTTSRVLWSSHYGPMLEREGTLPWSDSLAFTYRDANIDNLGLFEQFVGQFTATSLDEFIDVHRVVNGIPWVNTVAADVGGRVWYADTSATPQLSAEALAEWQAQISTDPLVRLADEGGFVLLDGSDPRFEWEDLPGARSPGLIPFEAQPSIERSDYVFNANDSYWIPHADERLTGFSPLQGGDELVRIPRTRENALLLDDDSDFDGPDGRFDLAELGDALWSNRALTAELLLDDVLTRCDPPPTITVETREIDLTEACDVLGSWDRRLDLDSVGAHVWYEVMAVLGPQIDELYAEPFDPADPIGTPRGLLPPPLDGPDPVLDALGDAVAVLEDAGIALDSALGDVQFTTRGTERIPIHGGPEVTGTANIVDYRGAIGTRAPRIPRAEVVNEASDVTTEGYFVNAGTSYLLVVDMVESGPIAEAVLVYGQSDDPGSPYLADQTRLYSAKQLRPVLFDEADILADPELREYAVQGD